MPPTLVEGRIVAARYRLDRCVGHGGTSVVWAATHVVTRRAYALKVLLEGAGNADGRRRMEREARAASAVKHPGVITVHDVVDLDDGTPVLVMDLLLGESLADLFDREKRLDLARFAELMLPVVSALGAAHAAGIVHRDLKPANVFILNGDRDEPEVKVLDFGIAKLTASHGDAAATAALTGTGMILGTPSYMAPEQVLGEGDIDRRADVWALGCIFYEALAGQRPTSADTVGKVLRIILTGSIRPIRELAPELPDDLASLVTRMLAFSRENRPDDLREVLEILSSYSSRSVPHFGKAAPAGPPSSVAPLATARGDDPALAATLPDAVPASRITRRTRRWLVLGLFGAALAVTGGSAVVSMLRREEMALPPPPLQADVPNGHCPAGMAELLGGAFMMGSNEGATEERPAHEARVASFCLDRTEVTVGAYSECVDDGACTPPGTSGSWVGKPPAGRTACADLGGSREAAVSCVTWAQADRYCRSRAGRLPSEAEWEYAARNGAAADPWPWGSEAPSPKHALLCEGDCAGGGGGGAVAGAEPDAGFAGPWPVGVRADGASRAGVLDLVGNVWEWTASPLCPYATPACAAKQRVFRGGGWTSADLAEARPTARRGGDPERRFGDVGFRCARDVR